MDGRRLQTVADIGSGYGWLAIAMALDSEVRIIAVEPDGTRLTAARHIAQIVGVEERIEWREASIG